MYSQLSNGNLATFGDAPVLFISFFFTCAALLYMLVFSIASGFADFPFVSFSGKTTEKAGFRANYATHFIEACGNYNDKDRKQASLGACGVALANELGGSLAYDAEWNISLSGNSLTLVKKEAKS